MIWWSAKAPTTTCRFFAGFYRRGKRRKNLEQDYFRNYHSHDERLPRLRRLPDGRLVHVTDLYTEKELKTSAAYNEALLRDQSQDSLNVRTEEQDGCRIVWAIGDPIGRTSWESGQIEAVKAFLPHVRQFVRLRQALSVAEASNGPFAQLLDNTRIGVIQLDRRGRIVEANDRALDTMRRCDGLMDQGGFLRAGLPSENGNLRRLLGRALPAFGVQRIGGSMTIKRSPLLAPLTLHVNPVGDGQIGFGGWRVAALVLVVESIPQSPIDPVVVAAALGLSPTQGRVAAWLAEGRSVRDIAALTGRKENSVRWNVKQIHRRLGISRQAELVRLVLSIPELSGFGHGRDYSNPPPEAASTAHKLNTETSPNLSN